MRASVADLFALVLESTPQGHADGNSFPCSWKFGVRSVATSNLRPGENSPRKSPWEGADVPDALRDVHITGSYESEWLGGEPIGHAACRTPPRWRARVPGVRDSGRRGQPRLRQQEEAAAPPPA